MPELQRESDIVTAITKSLNQACMQPGLGFLDVKRMPKHMLENWPGSESHYRPPSLPLITLQIDHDAGQSPRIVRLIIIRFIIDILIVDLCRYVKLCQDASLVRIQAFSPNVSRRPSLAVQQSLLPISAVHIFYL